MRERAPLSIILSFFLSLSCSPSAREKEKKEEKERAPDAITIS